MSEVDTRSVDIGKETSELGREGSTEVWPAVEDVCGKAGLEDNMIVVDGSTPGVEGTDDEDVGLGEELMTIS